MARARAAHRTRVHAAPVRGRCERAARARDGRRRGGRGDHRVRHRPVVRRQRAAARAGASRPRLGGQRPDRDEGRHVADGAAWVPDGRAKTIRSDCEASLEALDGLPIDLYLLHAPDTRTHWRRRSVRSRDSWTTGSCVASASATWAGENWTRRSRSRRSRPCRLRSASSTTALSAAASSSAVPRRRRRDRPLTARRAAARCGSRPAAGASRGRRGARRDPAEVALASVLGLGERVVAIPGARRPETARSAARAASIALDPAERECLVASRRVRAAARGAGGEVVVVIGIPGAGKSRAVNAYVRRGYARLNRDERGGTLRALADQLDAVLASGARRVVLDNTYVTRASRSHVLEAALRHGARARCVWIDTPLGQAQVNMVERLLDRFGVLPTPEELEAAARSEPGLMRPTSQMRMLRELEPPGVDKGFAEVQRIAFERDRRRGDRVLVAAAVLQSAGWREVIEAIDPARRIFSSTGSQTARRTTSPMRPRPCRPRCRDQSSRRCTRIAAARRSAGAARRCPACSSPRPRLWHGPGAMRAHRTWAAHRTLAATLGAPLVSPATARAGRQRPRRHGRCRASSWRRHPDATHDNEADARTRTADPFITSEVLYQLATSAGRDSSARRPAGARRRGPDRHQPPEPRRTRDEEPTAGRLRSPQGPRSRAAATAVPRLPRRPGRPRPSLEAVDSARVGKQPAQPDEEGSRNSDRFRLNSSTSRHAWRTTAAASSAPRAAGPPRRRGARRDGLSSRQRLRRRSRPRRGRGTSCRGRRGGEDLRALGAELRASDALLRLACRKVERVDELLLRRAGLAARGGAVEDDRRRPPRDRSPRRGTRRVRRRAARTAGARLVVELPRGPVETTAGQPRRATATLRRREPVRGADPGLDGRRARAAGRERAGSGSGSSPVAAELVRDSTSVA